MRRYIYMVEEKGMRRGRKKKGKNVNEQGQIGARMRQKRRKKRRARGRRQGQVGGEGGGRGERE